MNIQEFSHQMAREDHPSELIRALRSLRGLDVDRLRRLWPGDAKWGVWTGGGEPQNCAKQPGC